MRQDWTNIWARQVISGTKKFSQVPESRKEDVKKRIKELVPDFYEELINQ